MLLFSAFHYSSHALKAKEYVPSTEEIVRTLRGMTTLPLPLLLELLRTDDDDDVVVEGFEVSSREGGAFPEGCTIRCTLDSRVNGD
jgi:hypothetical protein